MMMPIPRPTITSMKSTLTINNNIHHVEQQVILTP
jgi:hypothetical protein